MDPRIRYDWELLPEYVTAQQFARCLGRILASLPPGVRRRVSRPLVGSATLIAQGIAGANAEAPPEAPLSMEDREVFRGTALRAVRLCRTGLGLLRDDGVGSRPDLLVALELLERIEGSVRERRLRG